MTSEAVLVGSALLLAGVLLSKTSSRLGVPSLLLFLFLGMLAGSEGLLGIEFDDAELAQRVGVIALALILFSGGVTTRWRDVRPMLGPGGALASVGVLVTAVALGLPAAWVLGLSILEGLLLGAIIAATDAAAVFSILRSRGVAIGDRLGSLLELESGSNDPAAVFLTVGLLSLIQDPDRAASSLLVLFTQQMGLGLVLGWLSARAAVRLINRLHLEYDGLYSVLLVALVLVVFEGTSMLGGSGFLAVYVAGLTMANSTFIHKTSLIRFLDGIGWLMQITMFVVFGLLVFPSELPPVATRAVFVAALLIFVARPVAVGVVLIPFRFGVREVAFVSWVGLRGATPIILATFPLVEGIPDADVIFNVVFFVVLTSVLVQGTSVRAAARLLGLLTTAPRTPSRAFEAVISGDSRHNLREVVIGDGSCAAGRSVVELGLPHGVLIVLLNRDGNVLVPEGGTVLLSGDEALVLAEGDVEYAAARRLLEGPTGDDGPHPATDA